MRLPANIAPTASFKADGRPLHHRVRAPASTRVAREERGPAAFARPPSPRRPAMVYTLLGACGGNDWDKTRIADKRNSG